MAKEPEEVLCVAAGSAWVESIERCCRSCGKVVYLSVQVAAHYRERGVTLLYSCISCAVQSGALESEIDPEGQAIGLREARDFIAQAGQPRDQA